MEEYTPLKRPPSEQSTLIAEEIVGRSSPRAAPENDFGNDLDNYIEASARSEKTGDDEWSDWTLDQATGYYYNNEKKLCSYWDMHTQSWAYVEFAAVYGDSSSRTQEDESSYSKQHTTRVETSN